MTAWGIGSIAAPAGRTGVAACSAGESGERAPPAYGGTRAGFCRLDVRLLGVASGEGGRSFSQTIASESPDLRINDQLARNTNMRARCVARTKRICAWQPLRGTDDDALTLIVDTMPKKRAGFERRSTE